MSIKVVAVNYDAEAEVVAFNAANDPSPPGKNMVLITVEATNIGSDELLDLFFDPFWNLVGSKGIEYDEFDPDCGVFLPGELEGELAPGATRQGNVCVQADEDDTNLVFFVEMFRDDFEFERLYLALE
jgi:hypothetical protein